MKDWCEHRWPHGPTLDERLFACTALCEVDMVATLLEAGADPNTLVPSLLGFAGVDMVTPLWIAANLDGCPTSPSHPAQRRIEMMTRLLDAGADPDAMGPGQATPLMRVAAQGDAVCLELLLERGADVDAVQADNGCTAFHCACYSGDPGCVVMLLQAGCDAYIEDKSGVTGCVWREYS